MKPIGFSQFSAELRGFLESKTLMQRATNMRKALASNQMTSPEQARTVTRQEPRKSRDLRQVIRFVIVGGWNTAFGYGLFAGLNYALTGVIPYPYMVANALAYLISITVAYFGYKIFVFKTKGNYLREYLRTYLVYGASCVANLALLPLAVMFVRSVYSNYVLAPYVAQAIVLPVVVLMSYFGHKKYSFRT